MANGYNYETGVDHCDAYSLVVNLTTIRMVSVSCIKGLVSLATWCLTMPFSIIDPNHPTFVCPNFTKQFMDLSKLREHNFDGEALFFLNWFLSDPIPTHPCLFILLAMILPDFLFELMIYLPPGVVTIILVLIRNFETTFKLKDLGRLHYYFLWLEGHSIAKSNIECDKEFFGNFNWKLLAWWSNRHHPSYLAWPAILHRHTELKGCRFV